MQNWFSPSQSPKSAKLVLQSKSSVPTETQANLLAVSHYKIKKKAIYLQDTVAQSKHSHSKREEWEHRKEE
jgi:hypothetical protein